MSPTVNASVYTSLLSSTERALFAYATPEPEGSLLGSGSRVRLIDHEVEVKLGGVYLHNEDYVIFFAYGPTGPFRRIKLVVPLRSAHLSFFQASYRYWLEKRNRLDNNYVLFPPTDAETAKSVNE